MPMVERPSIPANLPAMELKALFALALAVLASPSPSRARWTPAAPPAVWCCVYCRTDLQAGISPKDERNRGSFFTVRHSRRGDHLLAAGDRAPAATCCHVCTVSGFRTNRCVPYTPWVLPLYFRYRKVGYYYSHNCPASRYCASCSLLLLLAIFDGIDPSTGICPRWSTAAAGGRLSTASLYPRPCPRSPHSRCLCCCSPETNSRSRPPDWQLGADDHGGLRSSSHATWIALGN